MTMSFFLKAYLPLTQTSRIAAALVTLALAACASFPASPPQTVPTPAAAAPAPTPIPAPPPVVTFPAEDELPAMHATGGDPDSVTNVTLQLRSEYGDLWERI